MENFKTPNGDFHLIDNAGNHFVNKKCVNPKTIDDREGFVYGIGESYPPQGLRTKLPEITGKVPYKTGINGEFIRL